VERVVSPLDALRAAAGNWRGTHEIVYERG
jgi:hypothetical protein